MPLDPLRRREIDLLTVLDQRVQATAGSWNTHAQTRCPWILPRAPKLR